MNLSRQIVHRRRLPLGLALILPVVAVLAQGCNILGFGGAMIESYRRSSTKTVAAEYKGLQGKNWAVVVIADRSIQAELPDIVPWMTGKICERLTKEQPKIIAAGMVPPERVLRYQYDHPSWISMPHEELAKALTVDRLIVVEIIEYRLNDPGNQYLWSGLAAGTVGVVETESATPDEFAFEKSIRVKFPDEDNYGPTDFDRPTVATRLGGRFLDRVTWLFYSHEEPYYAKY
jgi:hypothetical protein